METQIRVIQALLMRETKTRYGKFKLGYVWAFIEPIMQIAVFGVFHLLAGHSSISGMPVIPFLITGFTPFLMFRHIMGQTTNAVESNRSLLAFPQVGIFDLVFARILLEAITFLLVMCVLLFATHYLGYDVRVENILGVAYAMTLLIAMGTGIGMTLCSLVTKFPSVKNLADPFFGRPLFFTSGLFFTAEMLPSRVRDLLLYNPLLSVTEYLRSSFFYEFESHYYNLSYATSFSVVVFAFGFSMLRLMRNQLLTGR